jgi:hypothetical protein
MPSGYRRNFVYQHLSGRSWWFPLPPRAEDYATMGDDGLAAGKPGLLEAPKEKWRSQWKTVREENGQLAISVDGAGWIGHEERNVLRDDRHEIRRSGRESMVRGATALPALPPGREKCMCHDES